MSTVEGTSVPALPRKEELPPGWEARIHSSGRIYYINKAQRTTQWRHPGVKDHEKTSRGSVGERVHGTSEAVSKEMVSTLPAGWEARMDPRTKRPYYVNRVARKTTWERPTVPATPATPVTTTTTTPATPPPPPPPPPTSKGLPTGWKAKVDSRTGRTYYVNHRTRRTTWTKPCNEERRASAPFANAAIGLPPGWEARVDERSKRIVYVDHNTKKTTWKRPTSVTNTEPRRQSAPTPSDLHTSLAEESKGHQESTPPIEEEEEKEEKEEKEEEQTATSGPESTSTTAANEEQGPLPTNWERVVDQASERSYFINHVTGQTSWKRPLSDGVVPPDDTNELPPGWEKRFDSYMKRWYYVNHIAETTTWVAPGRAAKCVPKTVPQTPIKKEEEEGCVVS